MKPTILFIRKLESGSKDDTRLAERLWNLRAARHTRYAATPSVSQQKRRKAARRQQKFPRR